MIRGLITALLASEPNAPIPMVTVGPGGTAKSMAIRGLCLALDASYFGWQLTPLTTPEDLFGVVRTNKMIEQAVVDRNGTSKLPGREVINADEIFNANQGVLVSLNEVLAEGTWSNNDGQYPLPMKLFAASTNQVPDTLGQDRILATTWDRFVLRYRVDYLQEEHNFRSMLNGVMKRRRSLAGPNLEIRTRISRQALEAAKAEIRAVDLSPVEDGITGLWSACKTFQYLVSDRRWGQLLAVIQVQAWLAGRTAAESDDLGILQHCLWDRPEQAEDVKNLVLTFLSSWYEDLQTWDDEANEQMYEFKYLDTADPAFMTRVGEINYKLKALIGNVKEQLRTETARCSAETARLTERLAKETDVQRNFELIGELRRLDECPTEILDTLERIVDYNSQVARRGMGA